MQFVGLSIVYSVCCTEYL